MHTTGTYYRWLHWLDYDHTKYFTHLLNSMVGTGPCCCMKSSTTSWCCCDGAAPSGRNPTDLLSKKWHRYPVFFSNGLARDGSPPLPPGCTAVWTLCTNARLLSLQEHRLKHGLSQCQPEPVWTRVLLAPLEVLLPLTPCGFIDSYI